MYTDTFTIYGTWNIAKPHNYSAEWRLVTKKESRLAAANVPGSLFGAALPWNAPWISLDSPKTSVSPRRPHVRVQWREALEQTSPGPVFENFFAKAPNLFQQKLEPTRGEMSCRFVLSSKKNATTSNWTSQSGTINLGWSDFKGPKLQNLPTPCIPINIALQDNTRILNPHDVTLDRKSSTFSRPLCKCELANFLGSAI